MPPLQPSKLFGKPHQLEIRRALLLEDDPDQVTLLRAILEPRGFLVTAVDNGVDGLREVMAHDFDVVICDLLMPRMPGDMFYLAVSRAKPAMMRRFIFVTGHAQEPKYIEFFEHVHGIVLHKPISVEAIVGAVDRVISGAAAAA
jgi:CheY-like chemotaxis protein